MCSWLSDVKTVLSDSEVVYVVCRLCCGDLFDIVLVLVSSEAVDVDEI